MWLLAVLYTVCDFTKYQKNIHNYTRNAFKITCKNLLLKCSKFKFRQKSQDGIKLDGFSRQCHWASSSRNKRPFLALSRAKKCWWNRRGNINLPSDFYAPLILQITEKFSQVCRNPSYHFICNGFNCLCYFPSLGFPCDVVMKFNWNVYQFWHSD